MSFHNLRHSLLGARAERARNPSQSKVRQIFLVDDEPVARELLADALKVEGYQVSQASNSFRALAALSSGETFDLLITDIDMPGDFNGLELARLVKEATPATKVIVLSGTIRLPNETWAIDRFIRKPATARQIRRHVAEILRDL